MSRDSKWLLMVHGVFVASFLEGFVVCSCSSFAFPDFQIKSTVSEVGEILFDLNPFCVV